MIVLIDNYDSFTYNLFQYFKQLDDWVQVFRNDQTTIEEISELDPDLIILSPGPGSPADSGICGGVLHAFYEDIPILGICLGHQLIVEFFGGKAVKGLRPMHGKVTAIVHDGKSVFEKIPNSIGVTRYHSLHTPIEEMPITLEISAMSEDGVVMAVRHHEYPVEGIQFHPESILTEYGFDMLRNVYYRALTHRKKIAGGVVQ